jgi:hypothetical protein
MTHSENRHYSYAQRSGRRVIFKDKKFPVVSAEHLIAMKLFAASNNHDRIFKDLSDVKEIVKNSEIDKDTIKKMFTKYGMDQFYQGVIGND